MANPGDQLEEDVQRVYDWLLNRKSEGIKVEKKKKLNGRLRIHEIDVYYEFARAGVTHRVAIECKDWGRKVDSAEIYSFHVTLNELAISGGPLVGIMISRHGFSDTAHTYAKSNGIRLMAFDDLPSFNAILADQIRVAVLPEDGDVGEPFWTIMERTEGSWPWSGHPQAINVLGMNHLPLFISKPDAEIFLNHYNFNDKDRLAICGLRKNRLRSMLLMTRACSCDAVVINGIASASPLQIEAKIHTLEQIAEKHLPGTDAIASLQKCPRIRDMRGLKKCDGVELI